MRWVLLPGLDGTGKLFAPLLARLPVGVTPTVVAYPADRRLSLAQLADHVRAYLPTTGEPFLLLAESFSGPVALRIAADRSPALRAVVLCASFAFLPFGPVSRFVLGCVSHVLFYLRPPAWAVRMILIGPDAPESLLLAFYGALARVEPAVLGHRLRLALAIDERANLGRLFVPLLWVQPTADWLVGRFNETSPGKTIRVAAPHLVLQRRPAEVVEVVCRWLERPDA